MKAQKNAWVDADFDKPPKDLLVFGYFDDGHYAAVKWNGMYWVGQHNMRLMSNAEIVKWFYFERPDDDD